LLWGQRRGIVHDAPDVILHLDLALRAAVLMVAHSDHAAISASVGGITSPAGRQSNLSRARRPDVRLCRNRRGHEGWLVRLWREQGWAKMELWRLSGGRICRAGYRVEACRE
jgi:hypothetical protein